MLASELVTRLSLFFANRWSKCNFFQHPQSYTLWFFCPKLSSCYRFSLKFQERDHAKHAVMTAAKSRESKPFWRRKSPFWDCTVFTERLGLITQFLANRGRLQGAWFTVALRYIDVCFWKVLISGYGAFVRYKGFRLFTNFSSSTPQAPCINFQMPVHVYMTRPGFSFEISGEFYSIVFSIAYVITIATLKYKPIKHNINILNPPIEQCYFRHAV